MPNNNTLPFGSLFGSTSAGHPTNFAGLDGPPADYFAKPAPLSSTSSFFGDLTGMSGLFGSLFGNPSPQQTSGVGFKTALLESLQKSADVRTDLQKQQMGLQKQGMYMNMGMQMLKMFTDMLNRPKAQEYEWVKNETFREPSNQTQRTAGSSAMRDRMTSLRSK